MPTAKPINDGTARFASLVLIALIASFAWASPAPGEAPHEPPGAAGAPTEIAPTPAAERSAAFNLYRSWAATIDGIPEVPAFGETTTVRINADNESLDFILEPFDARAPGYQLLVEQQDGSLKPAKPSRVTTMRGTVADAPGSIVAAAITAHGLVARIRFADHDPRSMLGDHWLEPVGSRIDGAPEPEYVWYANVDVIPSLATCGTEEAKVRMIDPPAKAGADPGILPIRRRHHAFAGDRSRGGEARSAGEDGEVTPTLFLTELAADADYEFFQDYNESVDEVEQRILQIINLVNLQYETEVRIRHEVTTIIVRTTEDDPYTANGSSALLNQFRTEWLENNQDIPHDVAILFTGRDINGSIIGQAATLGGICTSLRYCHNQTDCCGSTACATDLVAHELGHLWDGAHCSCASPSFTMNPSITCSNTFNPNVTRGAIAAHRDTRDCLELVISPDAPLNDLCSFAAPLEFGQMLATNVNAFDDGPPVVLNCGGFGSPGPQRDIWFTYTGEQFGFITIDLCGSDFDTSIVVYKDGCPSDAVAFECSDDGGCPTNPLAASVTFPTGAGVTFFIEIGSPSGQTGQLVMNVTFDPIIQPCDADLDLSGSVDAIDLGILLAQFGETDNDLAGDIDTNGTVDALDLSILLGAFALACP